MHYGFHVRKRAPEGWIVVRAGVERAASVHPTQAEAVAAARRLALKSGGAEVVIHRADGRIRDRDTIGAAEIDERKELGAATGQPAGRIRDGTSRPARPAARDLSGGASVRRAPRSEGTRTTLRVPAPVAAVADRLARDLGISRNDALLRLATRGAALYEHELGIAERRNARWAAVVPGIVDVDLTELPSADEAHDAILAARETQAEPAT